MKTQIAKALNSINVEFYNQCATSFSATRHNSWAGWGKALALADLAHPPQSVIDFACGNLRFETFLAEKYPQTTITAQCIDVCCDLAELGQARAGKVDADFVQEDIVNALIEDRLKRDLDSIGPCDLVVCMGFMHHIPSHKLRSEALKWLAGHVAEGGALIVSFWQFMESPRLAAQAERLTPSTLAERGILPEELEEGDCFLGWQNSESARRYCHNFTEKEVKVLAEEALPAADFRLAFFEADGKEKRLNRYLVATRR